MFDAFNGLFPTGLGGGAVAPWPTGPVEPTPFLGLGGLPSPATDGFPGTQIPAVADVNAPAGTPVGARTEGDRLAEALRGVRAPAAPETQRLGLPGYAPAPRGPAAVQGGGLLQMLQLLNAGSGATAKSSLDLPSTLGAALRGR